MKILTGVVGLLLGLALGLGMALANPIALLGGLGPLAPSGMITKQYRMDDARGAPVGVGALLGIGRGGDAAFKDPANRHVRLGIVVLPAGDGSPAALAVKASVISEENSLWRARLGALDFWNIFWPGEGSVFAAGYGNYWTLVRDLVWSAVRGKGRDGLARSYPVSAPPPPGTFRGVIGATGRFAGASGDLRETVAPRPDGSPDWTLNLNFKPPAIRQSP
jgi:hypothetical protein